MSIEGGADRSKTSWLARRPAVAVAGLLMSGIFAHDQVLIGPAGWLFLGAGLIAGATVLRRNGSVSSVLIAVAIVVTGISAGQIGGFRYSRNDIGAFAGDEPRLAQLEIRLDYPPRELTAPYSRGLAVAPRQVVTATVVRVKTWTGWVPTDGRALVQIAQPNPRLTQGQVIRVIGRLERPGPANNPGQFDWAGAYRDKRILASVRVDSGGGIEILEAGRVGPIDWLRAQTRRALASGFDANDALDHALLRALLLGDSDPELRDVQEQFRRTGTSHHLAISGLHVAILGAVVFGICRVLRVGPRTACFVGLAAVVLYGLVALPSPPVVRSVLLCLCIAIGVLQRRPGDMIQLLALSVSAMLVYHPLDLYNAGFQLSFGMVLGLMLFTERLTKWLPGRDVDVEVALSHVGPEVVHSPIRWAKIRARQIIAASMVAGVVSMPLVAIHFEQLNPWAIPASLLLGLVVFLSLIAGFVKLLLSVLWPSGAWLWAEMAQRPIRWMQWIVEWLATFPGADIPFPAPPIWMVLVFYGLLLLLLVRWERRWMAWGIQIAAAVCALLLVVVPLREGLTFFRAHVGELKVTFLSIGAGQCAVIEPPGADAVLVDAGSASLSDLAYKALGPFLRHQGRRDIRAVFVSHANLDHFSAVSEVVSGYDVPEVYASSQFRRHSVGNPPAEALLRTLDQLDRPPRIVTPGQSFDLGGGVKIECVWPPASATFDANNCSMLLRLTFGGKSILFTGDIQIPAQRELLKSPDMLRADVLVAPHHGSRENTTAEFIDAVAPEVIVSSNDRTLSMKQREFDREMLGRKFYRTHTSGAITVRISPTGRIEIDEFLRPTSLP